MRIGSLMTMCNVASEVAQRHGKDTLAVKEGQTRSSLLEQILMFGYRATPNSTNSQRDSPVSRVKMTRLTRESRAKQVATHPRVYSYPTPMGV
jgi:hypothetical protein